MNLKQKCEELDLDYRKALILYQVLPKQKEGSLDVLREYDEEYDGMIISLCTTNNGVIEPLFIDEDNWSDFKRKMKLSFTSNGHVDNPREGNIISFSNEVKSLFNIINMEYSTDKVVEVLNEYYKTGIYKKKLSDYFRDGFEIDANKQIQILNIGRIRN